MKEAGLILKGVTVGYGSRVLVERLDVEFPVGGLTAIVGRNGTGKSTLLRVMAGLALPLSGEIIAGGITLSDMPARRIAEHIGFVSTERIRMTNLRVRDVVALGRTPYTDWIGRLTPEDEDAVSAALSLVGMSGFVSKQMDTLSDGEAQRVMIARVLAQDTPVILLDEPTAFLDLPNRYEVCLLLRRLAHERGKTVIFSSHDLSIVMQLADNILVLDPKTSHLGTPAELVADGSFTHIFEGTSIGLDANGTIFFTKIFAE
jgi:iron complex transport system ATP-binding protein